MLSTILSAKAICLHRLRTNSVANILLSTRSKILSGGGGGEGVSVYIKGHQTLLLGSTEDRKEIGQLNKVTTL
jgi:hypothetical protein